MAQKRYRRNARGSIILPNGQTISMSEQKHFKSVVNSANRKIKRLQNELPKQAKSVFAEFGIRTDFMMTTKSYSFRRFRNKREFNQYVRQLERISKREYLSNVIDRYRKNLRRAVTNVFGTSGRKLNRFINQLSDKELRQLTLEGELEDIGYVYYEPQAVAVKLETLTKEVERIRSNR